MSDPTRTFRGFEIGGPDVDPAPEPIPRVDCATYIMDISLELARLADDASLSKTIGSSLRAVARAARNEVGRMHS